MKQRIKGKMPEFEGKYYIHSTACVIGDVHAKKFLNVWPNAVIRADDNRVEIGECVNVQDGVLIHPMVKTSIRIGNYVTIGHHAIVHGCEIGDFTLIGMGSIILEGARIGKNCMIGAGALIPPGKQIPDNSLVIGNPFEITRSVTEDEIKANIEGAKTYWESALEYIRSGDIY